MPPPPTLRTLVTDGLGYCCVSFFLEQFPSNTLVAIRLGLSKDTVKVWRRRCREGGEACTRGEGCLRRRLERLEGPR